MKDVKRLEIVIDAAHTPELITALKATNAPGYTLLRDVHGAGDRGDRAGDGLGNVFRNCYVILAIADDPTVQAVIDAVRPLIQAHGGMCLMSEAKWLKH